MAKKLAPVSSDIKTSPFLGFNLSTPAILAFIGYIVLALVVILPFKYPVVDQNTGEEYVVKYDFANRLVVLLVMAIPIALSVYSINCMMVGKCMIWSYIVAIIGVYWVALFVIMALIYTFRNKEAYSNANRAVQK
jgi:hypothetical protein